MTPGIHAAHEEGVDRLVAQKKVESVARGSESQGPHCGRVALFSVSASEAMSNPVIMDEVFGASSTVVRCAGEAELVSMLKHLEGQLTISTHLEPSDHPLADRLLAVLESKAGRLIVNGWPTGVEVSHAMGMADPSQPPPTAAVHRLERWRSTDSCARCVSRIFRRICCPPYCVTTS
jgi:2,5-dioxopentanoate dehydrogenase